MPYPEFATFAYSGAFIWCLSFISLGYIFGDQWEWILKRMHENILVAVIAIGSMVLSYLIFRKLMKRSK